MEISKTKSKILQVADRKGISLVSCSEAMNLQTVTGISSWLLRIHWVIKILKLFSYLLDAIIGNLGIYVK